jgi:hypothetical protein
MKIIIKHDLLEDKIEIMNIFREEHEQSKALQSVMNDVSLIQGSRNFQVVVKHKNEIVVYEKGLIYGKTHVYRYIIDSCYKNEFKRVLAEIIDDAITDDNVDDS